LLPLEKTGYIDRAGEKITEIELSVPQLVEMGASGAKLLIYFNPHVQSAPMQIETTKKLLADCKQANFPLFLEIVTYKPEGSFEGTEKSEMILASLQKFLEEGILPDVYKLEYPGNLENCQKITQMLKDTPWIILTAGDDFEVFLPKLEEAIKGGAKGFLAGRALWKEVCSMQGAEKVQFLKETLPSRFRQVVQIAQKYH
jgi:tagatose-1,6-bisphosphate aldolase